MPITINGTSGLVFNDGSTQANSQVGMKNRIIDGGFIINQRAYVSNTALSAGVYAHDRWKAGASGCTYTFTQGSLGVNTTITITAGTLVQVIEGCNLAEGGTYVLSWTGTAQGRLNGGTYGSSGTVTVTGWTAGTNLNVEFNTGTVGSVQLEKGATATSFDYRPYGTELALCQRYFYKIVGNLNPFAGLGSGVVTASTTARAYIKYPVNARTSPTISFGGAVYVYDGGNGTVTSVAINAGDQSCSVDFTCSGGGLTTGRGCVPNTANASTDFLQFSAEL